MFTRQGGGLSLEEEPTVKGGGMGAQICASVEDLGLVEARGGVVYVLGWIVD